MADAVTATPDNSEQLLTDPNYGSDESEYRRLQYIENLPFYRLNQTVQTTGNLVDQQMMKKAEPLSKALDYLQEESDGN
jgi:hypothetical protein